MTSLYVFILLLSPVFCHLNDSSSTSTIALLNDTKATTIGRNETVQTPTPTVLVSSTTITVSVSTTVKPAETTTTITALKSTVSLNITAIDESTTSTYNSSSSTKFSSKTRRWLLIAPLLTIVVVIAIGIIHYYRRQSPYRRCLPCWKQCKFRFLRNWQSRDDDADNIILQLEQPEVINGQWPPRISFA